jgi:ubiquinone/menaquinone biosynthesis C-methylase UbiE
MIKMSNPINRDAIINSFQKQASSFGDEKLTLANKEYLSWMMNFIQPRCEDIILDVASGTGHLAFVLAEKARQVFSLDLSEAMQAQAIFEAQNKSLKNVTFKIANAEDLPYKAGKFDKVTSRFGFHHFNDTAKVLSEMMRVLKPNGYAFIIDMIVPEGEEGKQSNHYEKLRDSSHAKSLTHREFTDLIGRVGLKLVEFDTREIEVETTRWLELTQTSEEMRDCIVNDFLNELAIGTTTGMQPFLKNNVLFFKQTWNLYKITKGD